MAGKKTRVRIENPTAVGPFINAIHGWNEGSNDPLRTEISRLYSMMRR